MQVTLSKGAILEDLKTLKDGNYVLEKFNKKRTNPQNAWIHGFLFPPAAKIMTKHLKIKITPKMAKYILKARCAVDYVSALDEWIQLDTRDMNTVRMMKFIEDCLKYMATKYGEYIEGPDDMNYNQIEE